MGYTLKDGKVTFDTQGDKPSSIKALQRDAKNLYNTICYSSWPSTLSILKVMVYKNIFKMSAEEVKAASPQVPHIVDTAIRAYAHLGDKLLKVRTMYTMDSIVPVEELKHYPDLPAGLEEAAKLAGVKEIRFIAKPKELGNKKRGLP